MRPETQSALVQALTGALAAHGRGALDEAELWLDQASRLSSAHPDLLHLRGLVALGKGQAGKAVAWLARATRASPRTAMYWNNLGVAQRTAGDLDAAAAAHRKALALKPGYASAQNNLGVVEAARGDYEAAARCFETALGLGAADADTFANAALALARDERGEAALSLLAQARRKGIVSPRLDIASGTALVAAGRMREAIETLREVTTRTPDDAEAWHNLGFACEKMDDLAAAADALTRALGLAPQDASTALSLGMVRLAQGDYVAGWELCRRRHAIGPDEAARPEPFAADLTGRRIRICRDQGVGDDLFFLRFAPELRRRGAEIVVDVDPRLHRMLARAGFATGGPTDTQVPSGDLPFRLGHARAADCPPALRLPPLPTLAERHRTALAALPRPWIAVSWRAGIRRQMKSIEPELLAAALRELPGTVIVVQRRPYAGEVERFAAALGRAAFDASGVNEDLESMLALMSVVDAHAAVSNTNLHLRAAAGGTTHVLVPSPAEWRWRVDGEGQLPWFRDHDAYRQDGDRGWKAALATLAKALARL